MKIYQPAAQIKDDSIEYILLNLNWFAIHSDGNRIVHTYWRGDSMIDGDIYFEDLDAKHPELSSRLTYIDHESSLNSLEKVNTAIATAALAFEGFVDVAPMCRRNTKFHLLTEIAKIEPVENTDMFSIECISFTSRQHPNRKLPSVQVNREDKIVVDSSTLELLWPGSSKHIPVMTGLGFTNREILDAVFKGFAQATSNIDLNLPDFSLES